jgi:hypothetical protein
VAHVPQDLHCRYALTEQSLPETNAVFGRFATRCSAFPHAIQGLGVVCVMPPVPGTEDSTDTTAAAAANAAMGRAFPL